MLHKPFYDPEKSYEENYEQGPFGAFSDGVVLEAVNAQDFSRSSHLEDGSHTDKNLEHLRPEFDFLGFKVNSPFGIPAGPLVNSKFIKAAFEKGFDICVYKTVRTRVKKSNEWPNILAVSVDGDLTPEKARKGLVANKEFVEPLAITNSFGNPSYDPKVWQADIINLVKWTNEHKGKIVCGMIEGTRWDENFSEQDFLDDWVLAARLMNETKVHVIEANFSCPNEGDKVKGLLCFDIAQSCRIAEAMKKEINKTPLVIKLPYFENETELEILIEKLGGIVDGFSAINTIPTNIYDEKGDQALPGGPWRLKSGVCGVPIKWAGLEMVKKLKKLREKFGYTYTIIGVGGVTTAEDFFEYRDAGADAVMSATGAMWNPYLAKEIKERLARP